MTITLDQCRAARTMLHWTQPELATAAGVGRVTVANFERGATIPYDSTLKTLQATLEAAGIIFTEKDETAGLGVRLRE